MVMTVGVIAVLGTTIGLSGLLCGASLVACLIGLCVCDLWG